MERRDWAALAALGVVVAVVAAGFGVAEWRAHERRAAVQDAYLQAELQAADPDPRTHGLKGFLRRADGSR